MSHVAAVCRNVCGTILPPSDERSASRTAREKAVLTDRCAGSYDYRVAAGHCYLYSVRQGGNRVATVELVREQGNVKPLQIRAACNAKPSKEVKIAVTKSISELKAA